MGTFRVTFSTLLVVVAALGASTSAAGGAERHRSVDPAPPPGPGDANRTYAANLEASVLPPNLEFSEALRPTLDRMWRYSPIFRRQCARIAEAHDVAILILAGRLPEYRKDEASAQTQITGRPGQPLRAEVWLGLHELELHIAHELEHIIERIDGVHVELMNALGIEGVSRYGNAFETARARETGRAVAREVQAAQSFASR